MRIPDSLATLHDYGIVNEVLRPLMSGKEAQIYLVTSGGKLCVAKIYKEAQNRSFKHRADYTEGRKVRNTRDQRAIDKRSKHGREQEEAAWRSTEVDVIYRLHAGGVRVPAPYHFVEGVLVMELVADADGNPAPRLGDIPFEPEEATRIYHHLLREVVRMLCAGIVHGDLSDFNVLVGADGPVVIDFPQAVDTAHNQGARSLLIRDVDNLHRFLTRFVPNARRLPYAEEMWDLHQNNALTPDTQLTGRYRSAQRQANTNDVLNLIRDANHDERKRRDALGLRGGPVIQEEEGRRTPPQENRGPRTQQPAYPRQNAQQPAYPRQNAQQPAYPRQVAKPKREIEVQVLRPRPQGVQPKAPPHADPAGPQQRSSQYGSQPNKLPVHATRRA
jgi:RIO kinase 1